MKRDVSHDNRSVNLQVVQIIWENSATRSFRLILLVGALDKSVLSSESFGILTASFVIGYLYGFRLLLVANDISLPETAYYDVLASRNYKISLTRIDVRD